MDSSSDNSRGENVVVPPYDVDRLDADDRFFDRERWHDVETSEEPDAEMAFAPLSPLSSFSIAVLLLVSVVAAAGGLGFAYYLHRASLLASLPIDKASKDYRTIPEQWIGYAQDQAVRILEVDMPGCFAASSQGDVFIGEEEKPILYHYSLQGALEATLPLDAVPTAVAVGEAETLFSGQLVVAFRNRLAVYSMDGKKQTEWAPFRKNGNVHSLALTSDAIFAADSTELVVLRFDEAGQLVREIGRKPKEPPQGDDVNVFPGFVVLGSPISLAVSRATGILFVANPGMHRVEAFTQDGHWEPSQSWGEASSNLFSFTGCCNPVCIASLSDGRIVTAEKSSNLRVKIFLTNRKLDCVVAGPDILTNPPLNVPLPQNFRAVTANDNNRFVLIAAISGDRIIVYDPILRIFRLFLPVHQNRNPSSPHLP